MLEILFGYWLAGGFDKEYDRGCGHNIYTKEDWDKWNKMKNKESKKKSSKKRGKK